MLTQQKLIKVFYNITYWLKLIIKYIFQGLILGTGIDNNIDNKCLV